jgi:hypothetical protein
VHKHNENLNLPKAARENVLTVCLAWRVYLRGAQDTESWGPSWMPRRRECGRNPTPWNESWRLKDLVPNSRCNDNGDNTWESPATVKEMDSGDCYRVTGYQPPPPRIRISGFWDAVCLHDMLMYVCMYVCICKDCSIDVRLASAWFENASFINRCQMNPNVSVSEIWTLQTGPRKMKTATLVDETV